MGLAIRIEFPYGQATDGNGADWEAPDRHTTSLSLSDRHAVFQRKLDEDKYEVTLSWDAAASLRETARHVYVLQPAGTASTFPFVCRFALRCCTC